MRVLEREMVHVDDIGKTVRRTLYVTDEVWRRVEKATVQAARRLFDPERSSSYDEFVIDSVRIQIDRGESGA